jgi:hypothetical protein
MLESPSEERGGQDRDKDKGMSNHRIPRNGTWETHYIRPRTQIRET